MSGQSDLPLALETTKIMEKNPSHVLTVAIVSTARGSEAAAPGAPGFEYEQGMHARAEMMQEQEMAHAHSHLRSCACTHPLTYARMRARKPVCTDAHANTQKGCMLMHMHACTGLSRHAVACAHARTNACIQPQASTHIHMYAHTHVLAHVSMREPPHARKCTCTHYTHANTHAHTYVHASIHKWGNLVGWGKLRGLVTVTAFAYVLVWILASLGKHGSPAFYFWSI